MNGPKISWHVLEEIDTNEFEYTQYKTYDEEGSYVPSETVNKTLRVWNNYIGQEDVSDAKQCKLVVSFKNFEDNFLLSLVKVQVNGNEPSSLEIDIDKGIIDIGELSGIANSGSDLNWANYKDLHISVGPIPDNIKSELKSMYFYLEYIEEDELNG